MPHVAPNTAPQAVESRTIFTLPHSLRTAAIARACRAALVEFCNDAPKWGKRELARWLSGPYAELTRASRELIPEAARPPSPARTTRVDRGRLAQVLRDAIASTRELLRAATYPEGGGLAAWDALRRGFVVRCEDDCGDEGWVPIDLPTMRLCDRAMSLWAADYLGSPDEYEARLGICDVCHVVTFDPLVRARARCAAHAQRRIEIEWPDGGHSICESHLTSSSSSSSSPSSYSYSSSRKGQYPAEPLSGIRTRPR